MIFLKNGIKIIDFFCWFFLLGLIICYVIPMMVTPAMPHGGGLNAEGCHRQNSDGTYQCHRAVAPVSRPSLTGVASVIDGDTIEVHGVRIRLFGIDAPESSQLCRDADGRDYRCGQVAALALADKIGRSPVECDDRGRDRYGRTIAVCRSGSIDLNLWLVSTGNAVAYRRYAADYVDDEADARVHRRGVWQGAFVVPELWRRGVR